MGKTRNGIGFGYRTGMASKGSKLKQIDADAQAFINASAITDSAQINALNTLVIDFKAAGDAWTKIKAAYPFVGATGDSQKYNLVNPADTDEAFRLSYTATGGIANGSYTSAAGRAANTHLVPDTVFGAADCQIMNYGISGVGLAGSRQASKFFDIVEANSNQKRHLNAKTTVDSSTLTSWILPTNFISVKRNGANVETWMNGIKIIDEAKTEAAGLPTIDAYIGAINISGTVTYVISQTGFVIFSLLLTDAEELAVYNAIQKFKIAQSIQVQLGDDIANSATFVDAIENSVITSSKLTITEVGAFQNIVVTKPSGSGVYQAFWLRETYYMALAGYLSSAEILNSYNYYKSKIPTTGDNAYWVPDHIMADGTIKWTAGDANTWGSRASLDGNAFMALLAYVYYRQSGSSAFITAEIDYLQDLLLNVPYTDNLVSVTDNAECVGWGYNDTIKMSGKLANLNCIYYDAFKSINTLCTELEITGKQFSAYAANILSGWSSTFYDGTYVKAATGKCSGQYDINAACYAAYLGLISENDSISIANYIITNIADLRYRGQFKYVPTAYYHSATVMWEAYITANQVGAYQSGGYWPIYLPYILHTLNRVNPTVATDSLKDALKYFKAVDNCVEWVGIPSNSNKGTIIYGSSGAMIKIALTMFD